MIVDSKTGKILVTSKQLLKDIKEYLNSFTDEEWVERLKKRKQRLTHQKESCILIYDISGKRKDKEINYRKGEL